MTLTEVKNILNITSTDHDTQYKALLPGMEDWVKETCNDDFSNYMPQGVKIFIAKKIQSFEKENGAVSESLGDYSISYGTEDKLVQQFLSPYIRADFA